MRKLVILLVVSSGWGQEYTAVKTSSKVEIETLSSTQRGAIAVAQAKLETARAEFNRVVEGIKLAHGVDSYTVRNTPSGCNVTTKSGEILDNAWLVIRTEEVNNCTLTANKRVEPIK